jgi:hypothetical protein
VCYLTQTLQQVALFREEAICPLESDLRRTPLRRTSENPQNANFVITEFYEVHKLIVPWRTYILLRCR